MIRRIRNTATAASSDTKKPGASANRPLALNGRDVETAAGGYSGLNGGTAMSSAALNLDLLPLMKGLIPEEHERNANSNKLINDLYKDIYFHDSIGGAAADLMSFLPFSDFSLGGLKDRKKLRKYEESLFRTNVRTLLPELSIDYLVQGSFIGSLIFDDKRNIYTDVMPHDINLCAIEHIPLFGQDPIITVRTDPNVTKILNRKGERIEQIKKRLGPEMVKHLLSGGYELDPINTLYVPRRTMTTSNREGTSYFKRILPIYLLEKNLFRGTLVESAKRQRSIMHLQCGSEDWEPSVPELEFLTSLFMNADADPIGAIVATRGDVQVQDVRQGGDFWNIINVWGDTTGVKLRALGMSESLLSGDASLASMESALSIMVDYIRSYRAMMERKVLKDRIFPMIAVTNGFYKTEEDRKKYEGSKWSAEKVLYELQDNGALEMPEVHWQKRLQPEGDNEYIQMLDTLCEKGVPITLRALAAAGGLDLDTLIADQEDDVKIRKKLAELKKVSGLGDENGGEETGSSLQQLAKWSEDNPYASNVLSEQAMKKGVGKRSITDRDYGDLAEVRGVSKTGKPRVLHNQKLANDVANAGISKALAKLNREQRKPRR